MQESYRQALGGIYPVPVLRLCRKTQTGKIIGKTCAKCQKITDFFRKSVVCYKGICYTWHGPKT